MKQINPLYGAVAGDIIGSVFEFHSIKTKKFELFTSRSRFTDDSVMTIATADALLHGLDYADAYRKWGTRYPDAGYGGMFSRWLEDPSARPYNSWGNGSAMRVSPVGWFCRSESEVLEEAAKSASVTHNHPEGIKGAQAAALAVFLARSGVKKEEIKREMESRFHYDLSSRTLADILPDYSFDVTCQGSLPAAILSFLESGNYEDAVRNAVSLGGDSDTLAAITGGIALAYYSDMPEGIVNGVSIRLPLDMAAVCEEFRNAYIRPNQDENRE